jgi:hypothetical protein
MPTIKPIDKLTFHDRLSRLSFDQAAKLLGAEGRKLILRGAKYSINLKEDVFLGGDLLRVNLVDGSVATLTLMKDAVARLHWNCTHCMVDKTKKQVESAQIQEKQRRERVAAAGGEMLGAVFHFLGELAGNNDNGQPVPDEVVNGVKARLNECVEIDDTGKARLTVTFANQQALDNLAKTLAKMMAK